MRSALSLAAVAALSTAAVAAPAGSAPFKRAANVTASQSNTQFGGKGAQWGNIKNNIKHVVYLMLENRSFDNIAGYWSFNKNIDNLLMNTTYCNAYTNPNYTIYGEAINICAAPYEDEVPLKDPDHNFAGVSYEIYQKWQPSNADFPTMGGFIERQSEKYSESPGDASFVINAQSEEQSGTLAFLAQNYGFWDSYHAEHPGPTNPNRQFATSGSTCGYVDNTNQAAGLFANYTGTTCAKSIFQALTEKNISWKNYYETDIIDAYMYEWVQENAMDRLQTADHFYSDLANGTLPTFSYINPECCSIDSMHPTSSIAAGEMMIKHLYDSIRQSQYWENTLLIINFDEHGGFADHVPPPVNIPAPQDGITYTGLSDAHNVTYDFTRLGVRVPAFIISPFIPANTLLKVNDGTSYEPTSAWTHSSFLHFFAELWDLNGMNNRVSWAKTFEGVFTDKARTDTPETLPTPTWVGGVGQPEPSVFYKLNQPYSYYENM